MANKLNVLDLVHILIKLATADIDAAMCVGRRLTCLTAPCLNSRVYFPRLRFSFISMLPYRHSADPASQGQSPMQMGSVGYAALNEMTWPPTRSESR